MKRRKTALMMLSVLMVLAIFLSACSGSKSSEATARKNQQANRDKAGIWLLVQLGSQLCLIHSILQMSPVQILKG